VFFRPEKEGFELMRAALPHLRLLTLPTDKIPLLTKYLTPDERTFVAGHVLFKVEETSRGPAPPSLTTNTTPRTNAILELIPENLIVDGYEKMTEQDLCSVQTGALTKLLYVFNVGQNCILKGVEILTEAKYFPPTSAKETKKARYFKTAWNPR